MTLRLTFLFLGLITLSITHFLALTFFIYWKYLWFDIPMHMLGGMCVALGISVLPYFRMRIPLRFETMLGYLSIVLCVGIAWEIFEYVAVITKLDDDFMFDTITDLFMDCIGGVFGYLLIQNIKKLEI